MFELITNLANLTFLHVQNLVIQFLICSANILVTACVWNMWKNELESDFLAKTCIETVGVIGLQMPDIFSCCHWVWIHVGWLYI